MNPIAPYNSGTLKNMVDKVKVYCAHIIPLVFDNTLSYYESLCACVAKVNQLCDAVNAQNLTIVEFTHMVEVEIAKLTEYVNQAITDLQTRLDEDEARLTTAEENITLNTARLDRHAQRLEGIDNTLVQHHTRIVGCENNITTLQENVTLIQSDISSLQTLLGELQDYVNTYFVKKADITSSVTQGNPNPVSSGGVYNALADVGDYLPDASYTEKGVIMLDGTAPNHALTVTHGVLDVNDASATTKGVVRVGDNIEVSSGVISVPTADATTKGVVGVDTLGGNISLTNGIIDVATGTKNNKGVLQVGTHLTVSGGVVDVPVADDLGGALGVVGPKLNSAITIDQGEIDVKTATTTTKGVVTLTNTLTSGDTTHVPTADCVYQAVQQGGQGFVPDATTTSKGIVQIGDNINVNAGTISVADGSTSTKGVVKAATNSTIQFNNGEITCNNALPAVPESGNYGTVRLGADTTGLSLNANYELTVNPATASKIGGVKVGDNLDVAADGEISVPIADSTTKGVVGVDALAGNVTLSNGIIDVPTGTTSTKGVLSVGDNLEVSGGRVSVPTANATTKGVVTVDALAGNLTLTNGVIDVPTGTKNAKGVLQVGTHLSVNGGVVDVPVADDLGGSYGVVAPALGGAITINQGEIDVKTATTSSKGAVTLASGVTSGDTTHVPTADAVYNAITSASVADATTTSKGIVQIGSNIDVSNGVISVPTANGSTTYGVVRLGSNSNLSMGNDGIIDVFTGTKNNKGVLQVGTNLSVTSGVVDVPDADTTTKGVMQVGDNLIVASGRVSVPLAGGSSSVAGVVAIDSTNTPLYTDHNDNEILKIKSATTSTSGIVQKTTTIASGNTDVPTSGAVYNAIQDSNTGLKLIELNTTNPTISDDVFLSTEGASTQSVSAVTSTSYGAVYKYGIISSIIKGTKNFYLWFKRSAFNNFTASWSSFLSEVTVHITNLVSTTGTNNVALDSIIGANYFPEYLVLNISCYTSGTTDTGFVVTLYKNN